MKNSIRKPLFVAASVSVMLFTTAVYAAPSNDSKEFVKKAAIGNKFEIEASRLALDKSKNTDVKEFASQIIKDHSRSGVNLDKAVKGSNTGLTVEAVPARVDDKHQEKLNELEKLSGKEFDEEYIETQEDAHKDAVELYKDYAKDGDDASLKSFASETLPTLKAHEDHVKQLKKSL